jgi:hypothetical protein
VVRRLVTLLGSGASVPSKLRVGGTAKLVAQTGPAVGGVSVSFRQYRFDTVHRRWLYVGSYGRKTDAAGRASLGWAPSKAGSYYWRASVASTAEFANNISPVYRWTVSR